MTNRVVLQLPRADYVCGVARHTAQALFTAHHVPTACIIDMGICVGEAVANAIKHGCAPKETVTLELWATDAVICARVHDHGEAFDPTAVLCCSQGDDALTICTGRGIMLIAQLSDLTVDHDDTGNHITMVIPYLKE